MLYDDCVGYGSPISRIDRLHLPHCSSSLSQSQRPSQKRDNSRQSPLRHWPSKARHLGVSPFGPGREANEAVVSGWHGGMVAWWHGGVARPAAYLQFSSSDMSPLPQSNSPSQSQLFGMQWRLTPHRNWPSLHLGAPAGKRMRTKLSTLLPYNNNKRNEDLWRGLLVVLGLVARWSAFRPTKSCFCCCSYKSLNYFARYRK